MEPVSVAVVTCVYGEDHARFLPAWIESVLGMNRQPGEILVATDRDYEIPGARVIVSACTWRHPQAYYHQQAVLAAETDWVWIMGVDDTVLPDALDGIEGVGADVWQMGYLRSDGLHHIPPKLTAAEYLALDGNPFVGASAVRADAFRRCGGFPDVAFEDWGLWRRMARAGCSFESSGRAHFNYTLGPGTRSSVELLAADRARHLEEMFASER